MICVRSEYGRLRTVLMASAMTFKVIDPINSTQRRYFTTTPPAVESLVVEQTLFADELRAAGVKIVWADSDVSSPLQLNTRDVGAVIGDIAVIGRMRYPVRSREDDIVVELLDQLGNRAHRISSGYLEGGDVLIDWPRVYVGISQRTDDEGCAQLEKLLRSSEIIVERIPLAPEVMHLDVVLNLATPSVALAYTEGLPAGIPRNVADRYEVVEITTDEWLRLGTNVFSISPNDVVVDRRNARIASELARRGVNVIEVDFMETNKIGGGFRCMTMPLLRDSE